MTTERGGRLRLVVAAWVLAAACGCASAPVDESRPTPWRGSWQSARVPSIAGGLRAELPGRLRPGPTLTVPVTISYAAASPYMPGEAIAVDFELTVTEEGAALGGGRREGGALVWLKGSPREGQTIWFSADQLPDEGVLTGEYMSEGPVDAGTFELSRS